MPNHRPHGHRSPGRSHAVVTKATFSLAEISGLRFWQEADRIGGKSTGDTITQWDDVSGSGNHLTEATNPPTFRATDGPSGLPAVRFDGSDDQLRKTGLSGDTDWTAFLVMRQRTAPSGATKAAWGTATNASLITGSPFSATSFDWHLNEAVNITPLTGTATAWTIYVVRVNSAASVDVYAGGGSPTNLDPLIDAVSGTDRYLGTNSTWWSDVDYYLYGEYDSALTATNLNRVGNHLSNKTGLSWTAA